MKVREKLGQAGFTLTELMISIGIATVLTTVLLAISLTYFGDTVRAQITAQLGIETHFVLRTIIEDIRLASGISPTNVITDANAPTGGWTTSAVENRIIIDSPTIDSSRNLIYDTSTGYPYSNQSIYYISQGKLLKRTLKNTSATGNIAVTTCPAAIASPSCPADKEYTAYANDLEFVFYDSSNAVTTDVTLARSVKVTVTMSRKSFGKTIQFVNSIQTTLRNY